MQENGTENKNKTVRTQPTSRTERTTKMPTKKQRMPQPPTEMMEIKSGSVWRKPDGEEIQVLYGGVFTNDEHVSVRNVKSGRRSRPKLYYFASIYDRVA